MTTTTPQHTTEHDITIDAAAAAIFELLADVSNWPRIFPPTVYADRVEHSGDTERIRIWATANGQVRNWTSRRVLTPHELRIEFRQEVSSPPIAAMSGTWVIEPLSTGTSRVRLLHEYSADRPANLEWIDRTVEHNSRSELEALKHNVEWATAVEELTFSFEDTVRIGGPAQAAFDFVNEAQHWAQRLPHVADVRLTESKPGLQFLEMDTRSPDGSAHTTASHRITFPHSKIAYKQITLPALMALHTGYWTFTEVPGGATASSQHTVVLNQDRITEVLGATATVADARDYVRRALSTNSGTTLARAKDYAEDPARR